MADNITMSCGKRTPNAIANPPALSKNVTINVVADSAALRASPRRTDDTPPNYNKLHLCTEGCDCKQPVSNEGEWLSKNLVTVWWKKTNAWNEHPRAALTHSSCILLPCRLHNLSAGQKRQYFWYHQYQSEFHSAPRTFTAILCFTENINWIHVCEFAAW